MLKFISENKFKKILSSQNFLLLSCAVIFLLSIFCRSMGDIGADTGVYLDLGRKIAEGKKYFYDFFESNFPLSFYFYALQYKLSTLIHVDPIILAEIFINLLALFSICWSAKILQGAVISEEKINYNLLLISYFLSFFLRPGALESGEFGTKTSLLLILLYPYLSFSFARKNPFSQEELQWRGFLMGLIPCLKPHYLVLIIFIEAQGFWRRRNFGFFFELDKLVMYLVGTIYLFLMMKFTPEFFEFIVPLWPKTYSAYDNFGIFSRNISSLLGGIILPFSFIFLLFSRLKLNENNRLLALLFAGSACLIILENIGTLDQIAVFYAVTTICLVKFLYEIFTSEKISFSQNKFILVGLLFLPAFDLGILPAAIFGMGGIINIWWFFALLAPLFLRKKLSEEQRQKYFTLPKVLLFLTAYFLILAGGVLTLKHLGSWAYLAFNLAALFPLLFFFERKIYAKISPHFSPFTIFVIFASITCILYSHITAIANVFSRNNVYSYPNKLSEMVVYYSKIYAPKNDENFLMVSVWIAHQFPSLNYLHKQNPLKYHVAQILADQGSTKNHLFFQINDKDHLLAYSYLFEDLKDQLKNPQTKIIFFNNSADILHKDDRCLITTLEYYLLDPEFKKLFLKNFHFENHVIITHEVEPLQKIGLLSEEQSVFDKIEPSRKKVLHDFEVYVRNEN